MIKYYYEDKTKKELKTVIKDTFKENDRCFVRLEDSIFYPQGGGQKGDRGYLVLDNQKYNIVNSIKDEGYNSILIMDCEVDRKYIGADVNCYLDWDFRYKQMRLHTALHLYHALIEEMIDDKLENPLLSTIEDGYAVNKYDENAFDINILEKVTEKFKELVKTGAPVATYSDQDKENYRYWKCMDYVIPCGGVHVDNLHEIGDVDIEITHKKKAITVKIVLDKCILRQ